MDGTAPPSEVPAEGRRTPWSWIALTTAFYLVALFAATYPSFLSFGSRISGESDQLQHLWIMRSNRANVLQGRFSPIAGGLQYPIGAPLGNFSPLHFQSLLFFFLDPILGDAGAYNLIWLVGMVGTGLGTAILANSLLRDRRAATFAGLVAMLCGPMILHGQGHLELIHMEWFPIFMLAWMKFLDAPGRRSLLFAAGTYILVAMSAAYFSLLSLIPAVLYLLWSVSKVRPSEFLSWARPRAIWGLGFVALTGPALLALFSGQIWATTHGFALKRSRDVFDASGAPLWAYGTSTFIHRSRPFRLFDVYGLADKVLHLENASYLGLVAILFLGIAALARVQFRKAGFWWASTALLVLLSCGTSWTIAGSRIPLPAAWLWDYVPIYRMLRTPARFNLLACVSASILAAAGFSAILSKLRSESARSLLFAIAISLTVFDLSIRMPTVPVKPAPPPAAFAYIKGQKPDATVIEVPHCQSGHPSKVNSLGTYWQSLHHLRTTAGYSGVSNVPYDQLMFETSPFCFDRLLNSGFLSSDCRMTLETVVGAEFLDYAWVYLHAHRLDYVVLHQSPHVLDDAPFNIPGLKAVLARALVFEDADTVVYDPDRIRTPIRPTIVCTKGWRQRGGWGRAASKVAELAVYNPSADRDLILTMDAMSLRRPRNVVVRSGLVEIARWNVSPRACMRLESPAFRIPAGLGSITIESESESMPDGYDLPELTTPYSLRVAALSIREAAPAIARGPSPKSTAR